MPKKKVKKRKFRLAVKLSLCLVYLIIISILVTSAFRLYKKDREIVKWKDVTSTENYTYINISQMSEAFGVIEKENKQFHFIIEKQSSGQWYTYLIAINKNEYQNYKKIIDYTYERTTEKPSDMKIYGYPRKITKNIKSLAIQNIKNFVPIENQVVLTEENFEEYLTNTYLDTTIPNTYDTNYIVVILLTMAFIVFVLVIFTIFDKDKIVDEVDEIIEKEIEKEMKKQKKRKKKTTKKEEKKTDSKTTKKKSNNKKKETIKKETPKKKETTKDKKVQTNKKTTTKKTTTKDTKENKPKKTEKKKEEEIEIL